MYTIRIGGNKFKECVNITILGLNNNKATIPHIKIEPECGYNKLLPTGFGTKLVEISLNIIKMFFHNLQIFTFDDASQIECETLKNTELPRKLKKPLNLPSLYIALYGKTWYEQKFKAKILDDNKYKEYKEKVKVLYTIVNLQFYDFLKLADLHETSPQAIKLRSYYEKAYNNMSWIDMFQSIPKKEHCEIFWNWLSGFIERFIGFNVQEYKWYIDINDIPDMIDDIKIIKLHCGGNRKTLKKKYSKNKKTMKKRIYND